MTDCTFDDRKCETFISTLFVIAHCDLIDMLSRRRASEKRKQKNAEKREQKEKEKKAEEERKKVEEERKLKREKQKKRDHAARKFGEIFSDLSAGKKLEKRIYRENGGDTNDRYHKHVSELTFNLSKNGDLLNKVLQGEVTLKQLSKMSNEELAPKNLAEERKQRDEQFKKENTLQTKMVFGKVMDGQQLLGNRDDINDDKYGTKEEDVAMEDPIDTVHTVDTANTVGTTVVSTVPAVQPPTVQPPTTPHQETAKNVDTINTPNGTPSVSDTSTPSMSTPITPQTPQSNHLNDRDRIENNHLKAPADPSNAVVSSPSTAGGTPPSSVSPMTPRKQPERTVDRTQYANGSGAVSSRHRDGDRMDSNHKIPRNGTSNGHRSSHYDRRDRDYDRMDRRDRDRDRDRDRHRDRDYNRDRDRDRDRDRNRGDHRSDDRSDHRIDRRSDHRNEHRSDHHKDRRNGHIPKTPSTPKRETFDSNKMTELLRSCKSRIKVKPPPKPVDEGPLRIQRDSSDEEDAMDQEEVETTVLPPPPPPAEFQYPPSNGSSSKRDNVWSGSLKKSSQEKAFNLQFHHIGGQSTMLKRVIPKSLQINGRMKFKDISSCLADLVKVTRSKFTVILKAKCDPKQFVKSTETAKDSKDSKDDKESKEEADNEMESRNRYDDIVRECRTNKRGLVVDMKKTKAKIKIILMPSIKDTDSEFDVKALQKLWKCSLPKTDDLWALLTVYTKDKDTERTPGRESRSTGKPSSRSRDKVNGSRNERRERDRDRDRERGDHRDRERHSDRHSESDRERSSEKEARVREDRRRRHDDKGRDREREKERGRDRRGNHENREHKDSRREKERDRERDRSRREHRNGDRRDGDRARDRNKEERLRDSHRNSSSSSRR